MSSTFGECERAAKRKRYTSRIITLKIGKDKEELTVHEDVLCENSPFFKAGLAKRWKEGASSEFELPDDEHDTLVGYTHWLYKGEVMGLLHSRGQMKYALLAKAYVFGEKIQDDGFCDAVLSKMLYGMEIQDKGEMVWFPGEKCTQIVYAGTPETSPIRRMLVTMFVENAEPIWLERPDDGGYPTPFLVDVGVEFLKRRGTQDPVPLLFRKEEWFKKKEETKTDASKT